MKMSRWILTLAAGAVVAGLGIGAAAYLGTSGVEAQSPGAPATLQWLPASASVVGHVDFTALVNSPFRDQWEKRIAERGKTDELEEFTAATGIDPFTDLHRASFALVTLGGKSDGTGGPHAGHPSAESWGVAVQGVFDHDAIIAKVETVADVAFEEYHGATIYYPTPRHGAVTDKPALAFVGNDTIVIADRDYIREMLDAGQGRIATAGPTLDQSWGEGAFLDDSLWIVAAPEKGFAGMLPEGGEIPPIQSLAFAARLDADVVLRARGIAADPTSAIKLADVVRGFVALGSLQQGTNPDLTTLLDSIQIGQSNTEVEISLSVPYETLERLSQRAETKGDAAQN